VIFLFVFLLVFCSVCVIENRQCVTVGTVRDIQWFCYPGMMYCSDIRMRRSERPVSTFLSFCDTIISMSVHEAISPVRIKPRDYTQEKGVFVAEQFAGGVSLADLADNYPDYVPAAMYVKQWRVDYPQFASMMQYAEAALADVLVDQCTDLADDIKRPAAHAANGIKVRLARAAALDQNVYGNKRIIAGDPDNPLLVGKAEVLTDDELMLIARGGVVDNQVKPTPVHPPLTVDGHVDSGLRDTPIPTKAPHRDSVTTLKTGVDPGF